MKKVDAIGILLDALQFSADRHRGQQRKDGGTAYINHPIAVAHKLKHIGGIVDPVVLCSAILHDTLEDTTTTKDELAERFGEEIAEVVWEVTDDLALKADKNRKAERKQLEIDHAPMLSHRAKLVKMADKICNAEDTLITPPADWSIEEKRGYINWAKQVIDGMRGTNKALEAEFDELYAKRPLCSVIPRLTNELLARLIDIGRREAFDEFQQLLANFPQIRSGNLMRQGQEMWLEVARRYSSDDVEALIKALTVAERDLLNFNCGSVSPVIPLYQHLFNMPDADLTELRDWVVAHTSNGYLPFGRTRYHPASWPEYVSQQKEDGDRRLAREQAEIEALAARRAARQKQREEQQQSRLQLCQSRAALIESLQHLSPAERLAHIIGDTTHPVTFYPAEWAALDSGVIQALPPRVRLAAVQRLADRRTGIWKKLREQLEQNGTN